MQCKYCQKELDEGVTVCPYCGESQEESKTSQQLRRVKILLTGFVGLILFVLLAGVVHYGVTGSFLPRKNDLHYKTSYTVSAEKLKSESGYKAYEKKLDKVVATMGEHKMTNRLLQVYYWTLVNRSSYTDLDKTKPLDTQYQDAQTNTTWEQFFIQQAIDTWKKEMIMSDAAAAAGYQMPEDYGSQFTTLQADLEKAAISRGHANVDEYLEENVGKGVNFQTYYDYLWNYYYGGLYWAEYAENLQVTDAQIEAYFQEHAQELASGKYGFPVTKETGKLVDVRHILVNITGGTKDEDGQTVYSEEEWEACRVKAQAILDEWLAGEKTEDSFGKLAYEKTEDTYSKTSGGLYEYIYEGQMTEAFEEWCFDDIRQKGDTDLVKTPYGYHVMYFIYGEEGWIRLCRDGAKLTASDAELEQKKAEQTVSVNYKNIVIGEME